MHLINSIKRSYGFNGFSFFPSIYRIIHIKIMFLSCFQTFFPYKILFFITDEVFKWIFDVNDFRKSIAPQFSWYYSNSTTENSFWRGKLIQFPLIHFFVSFVCLSTFKCDLVLWESPDGKFCKPEQKFKES
jgi:hypothetical protein